MATTELVQELQSAAVSVTRQLPEAHTVTGPLREPRFRQAAERFIEVLYRVDVSVLTDDQLALIEAATLVAKNITEVHMTLRYGPQDTAACRYWSDFVNRLRDALDALDSGLSPDPSRRPTDDQLLASLASDLDKAAQLRTS